MGKIGRAKRKEKKLQKKRAIKAANRARYAELKRLGQNSKSKRFLKGCKKNKLVNYISHPDGFCGNVGCKKCDPCKIHNVA